jgi:nitroreductase
MPRLVPGPKIDDRSDDELLRRAREFDEAMQRRRTIREFSERPVPRKIIEDCLRAAGTAPSGANLQPWHFVAVSDAAVKHEIRLAAEAEEKEFYEHRAESVVGSVGADWNRLEQTIPGYRAVAHRHFRAATSVSAGRNAFTHLLRHRVGRDRHRSPGHRRAYLRISCLNPYPEPNGFPE